MWEKRESGRRLEKRKFCVKITTNQIDQMINLIKTKGSPRENEVLAGNWKSVRKVINDFIFPSFSLFPLDRVNCTQGLQ
jgi:hypothetical protein